MEIRERLRLGNVGRLRNLNGPIYVPLRSVVEAIGGSAEWDDSSGTATASFRGQTARVFPNSNNVAVEGGASKQMSVPVFNADNHFWVPLEFFENLGITAVGDAASNTVTINV